MKVNVLLLSDAKPTISQCVEATTRKSVNKTPDNHKPLFRKLFIFKDLENLLVIEDGIYTHQTKGSHDGDFQNTHFCNYSYDVLIKQTN